MTAQKRARTFDKTREGVRFGAGFGLVIGCGLALSHDIPMIVAVFVVGVAEIGVTAWRALKWR
jgi:hypothetical protein